MGLSPSKPKKPIDLLRSSSPTVEPISTLERSAETNLTNVRGFANAICSTTRHIQEELDATKADLIALKAAPDNVEIKKKVAAALERIVDIGEDLENIETAARFIVTHADRL